MVAAELPQLAILHNDIRGSGNAGDLDRINSDCHGDNRAWHRFERKDNDIRRQLLRHEVAEFLWTHVHLGVGHIHVEC
jgi:hypothetical protein